MLRVEDRLRAISVLEKGALAVELRDSAINRQAEIKNVPLSVIELSVTPLITNII